MPVKELVSKYKADYKLNTSYQQMWLAKYMMKNLCLVVLEKSFHMILALMSKIQEENLSSVVN